MTGNEREEIAGLKEEVKYIGKGLDKIMDNHLPHIESWLKTLTFWIIGLLATTCLSVIGIAVTLYIKL